MLSRLRRYCGTLFKVSRGVTQGDLLFHTIYNMVVRTVTHQWETVVARKFAVPEGFRRAVKIWPQFYMQMMGYSPTCVWPG